MSLVWVVEMWWGTMLLNHVRHVFRHAITGTFGCFCPILLLHMSVWTRQVRIPYIGKHKLVWAELRPEDQEPVFR
jgi:hypothetical protein